MKRLSCFTGLVLVGILLALAGFPQPTASADADTTPPTGTIIINNNRSTTNTPSVMLTLTWSDGTGSGVSRMRFSTDGASWTGWEVLSSPRSYVLGGGDGYKTMRVQYLDKANNRSLVYSDYIRLDTIAPTGGIIINHGDAITINRNVTLGLTWADGTGAGVSRMRFSDDGAHWTPWETASTPRAYTLPEGLGYHTVRVQYIDGANNYSPVYTDYIKLVAPAAAKEETIMLPGGVPMVMVWISGGTYLMGHYPDEELSDSSEEPRHSVTLSGFWMAKYELTKRQWAAVMGTSPWTGQGYVLDNLDSPAVYVSRNNVDDFLTAINSYTGKTFHLPSEAQWEYAARGGTTTRFYWGDDLDITVINNYAWWNDNAWEANEKYAHVVGLKTANAVGLYDMSGNVLEWCEDDWHADYTGAPATGQAWVDAPRGGSRIERGGGWGDIGGCRSAWRFGISPYGTSSDIGFRLAR